MVTADAGTDFWRITGYGYIRDNGHLYGEQIGGDFVSIQVCTLDDVTPEELIAAPVKYSNGRDNSWWNTPEETRHL